MNVKQNISRPHIYEWAVNEKLFSMLEKYKELYILYPSFVHFLFENFDKFNLDTSIPEYHYLEYVKTVINVIYLDKKIKFNLDGFSLNTKKHILDLSRNNIAITINENFDTVESLKDNRIKCIFLSKI